MIPIDVLKSIADENNAREALQRKVLINALVTAATDSRPVFTAAAEKAAHDLIQFRLIQSGLANLITEIGA